MKNIIMIHDYTIYITTSGTPYDTQTHMEMLEENGINHTEHLKLFYVEGYPKMYYNIDVTDLKKAIRLVKETNAKLSVMLYIYRDQHCPTANEMKLVCDTAKMHNLSYAQAGVQRLQVNPDSLEQIIEFATDLDKHGLHVQIV